MSRLTKILGAAFLTLLAAACGQKGDLYYSDAPAARNRASLGQSLRPSMPASATPAPQPVPLPAIVPATPPLPLPNS